MGELKPQNCPDCGNTICTYDGIKVVIRCSNCKNESVEFHIIGDKLFKVVEVKEL